MQKDLLNNLEIETIIKMSPEPVYRIKELTTETKITTNIIKGLNLHNQQKPSSPRCQTHNHTNKRSRGNRCGSTP